MPHGHHKEYTYRRYTNEWSYAIMKKKTSREEKSDKRTKKIWEFVSQKTMK